MAECEMKTVTDKRGEAGRSHTERQPCSTMHEQGIPVDRKLPLKKLSSYIYMYTFQGSQVHVLFLKYFFLTLYL